mgnify:CR=1 FL=1
MKKTPSSHAAIRVFLTFPEALSSVHPVCAERPSCCTCGRTLRSLTSGATSIRACPVSMTGTTTPSFWPQPASSAWAFRTVSPACCRRISSCPPPDRGLLPSKPVRMTNRSSGCCRPSTTSGRQQPSRLNGPAPQPSAAAARFRPEPLPPGREETSSSVPSSPRPTAAPA